MVQTVSFAVIDIRIIQAAAFHRLDPQNVDDGISWRYQPSNTERRLSWYFYLLSLHFLETLASLEKDQKREVTQKKLQFNSGLRSTPGSMRRINLAPVIWVQLYAEGFLRPWGNWCYRVIVWKPVGKQLFSSIDLRQGILMGWANNVY